MLKDVGMEVPKSKVHAACRERQEMMAIITCLSQTDMPLLVYSVYMYGTYKEITHVPNHNETNPYLGDCEFM